MNAQEHLAHQPFLSCLPRHAVAVLQLLSEKRMCMCKHAWYMYLYVESVMAVYTYAAYVYVRQKSLLLM
jgi:hypothetical protein